MFGFVESFWLSGKDFSLTIFQYPADGRIQRVDKGEKLTLVFRVCELDDTGTYSVEITEFVKNGEKDQTDCWLEVEGRYIQNYSIETGEFNFPEYLD